MKQDIHFRIYADIECINIPISDEVLAEIYAEEVSNEVNSQVPTVDEYIEARGITSIQEPIAIGYYLIDDIAKTNVYYSHFGLDCIDWFVDQMMNINYRASQLIDLPINMTEEDEIHFNETNICWLCEKETITTKNRDCNSDFCYGKCSRCYTTYEDVEDKVRDHDHLTGKYRGPAYNKCNLKCRLQKFIPVFFHNFSGYDCHLIFEKLLSKWFELIKTLRDTNPNQYNTLKPCILPKSIEKYISLEIGHLRFLDSNSFLQSTLEKKCIMSTKGVFYSFEQPTL